MTRILYAFILVAVIVVSIAAMLIYLAYGIEDTPPSVMVSTAISGETVIDWHTDYTRIAAPDDISLFTALGVAHAMDRTWTINLWRQVAIGRTSAWYGAQADGIDSLALQLGIASSARSAFRMLPEDERERLEAYSEGINTALNRRSTRLADEFTMLGIAPEPWEPWHTLAIEKLFAWVATAPLPRTDLIDTPTDVRELVARSREMRNLLAVHDLHHSTLFGTAGPKAAVGARFVYGSAAESILTEHILETGGNRRIVAMLPGTPFPFLTSETGRVFALLPNGDAQLAEIVSDTTMFASAHERTTDRRGQEHVLTFRRDAGRLVLSSSEVDAPVDTVLVPVDDFPDAPPDTVIQRRPTTLYRVLEWHGIEAPSDAVAFAAALRGETATFSLFRGGSLTASGEGFDVDGVPSVVATSGGAVALGPEDWVEPLAERLSVLQTQADSIGATVVMDDVRSAWAESLVPSMVSAAASIPDPPPSVDEALSYLRNWNYEYDGANIAASIFDEWIGLYRDSLEFLPQPGPDDSLFTERYLRYHLLGGAIDSLAQRYGPDMSQWRWERTRPDRRYVAGFPAQGALQVRRNRRYDAIDLPGRGHPSTVYFGTTSLGEMLLGSAAWEAWASLSALDSLTVRRSNIDVGSFQGRYIDSHRAPVPIRFTSAPPERTTTLLPPESGESEELNPSEPSSTADVVTIGNGRL